MERPWLMLGRVLLVDPEADEYAEAAVAQAQAQHPVVGEAEDEDEDMLAQDEQDGGAGGAAVQQVEAAVVDVEVEMVEAQDEQQQAAAVGQAGAGEEEEEDPVQAELEESVVDMNTNIAESAAAHAAAAEPDFAIAVAAPPLVTSLIVGAGSHPDPERPDLYPYIVATGPFCLLVHFAVAPSYGTNFDEEPDDSHLVVVRHFRRAEGGHVAACAVRVPDRPDDDDDEFPALRNIESVALMCEQHTGHFKIAELIVTTGAEETDVVYISSDEPGVWHGSYYQNPLLRSDNRRDWVPHGTVTINSTVLWFDLSWGIISCDLAQQHEDQVLGFHRLPPGRLLRAGAGAMPDLHCRRCIAVSENMVRYVEIILNDPPQATTVNMWYRDVEINAEGWNTNYSVSFEDIWDDDSYDQTGLPRNLPMLAGVSPVNSRVVYFTLDQRLFGVDVPEHRVVHCVAYEPLSRPGPPDEPVTSRYLITWNLDGDEAPHVGFQPDEPSDHADSSASGPLDEGDMDYQTPSPSE